MAALIMAGSCNGGPCVNVYTDPTTNQIVITANQNMPGAVPATSTYALANATIGYAIAIANKGWEKAMGEDPSLGYGLNVHDGQIRYAAVAKAHNL
jgi:alanine dehydrogenase